MLTNFAALTNEQKTVWSRDLWKMARNYSFINKFLGKSPNALVHHIDELTKTEKGARAVVTLIADMESDGVVGDRTLEGKEEALRVYDKVIRIDQMRNANRSHGRMADQKTIVNFRSNSRDVLAYWLAERLDQLAFLTLSGVSYAKHNNGADRADGQFQQLEFAEDVRPPTPARIARWDGTNKKLNIGAGSNTLANGDTLSWETLVQLRAYAKDQFLRGVKGEGGEETFHVFVTPQAMARLKLDPTYMANLRGAQSRSGSNPLFTGESVKVDGLMIHEYRNVYNTAGAASGKKWGSGGNVDGCQMLFCGAQALAMADIGSPMWEEKEFDYGNQAGISIAKILGFLKPQFTSMYAGNTEQDFGVISTYVSY